MLLVLLGTAEIGNFYLQRASFGNLAHSIATAIQENPIITAQELYKFQKGYGSLMGLKEVKKSDGSASTDAAVECSVKDCRLEGLEVNIIAKGQPVHQSSIAEVTL